jgi:LuxR family maltose regulon positive regulatory protein
VRNPALGAYVAARAGELTEALELATAAERSADVMGLGVHDPGRIFAALACAEVHIERGQDELARRVLDDAKRAAVASLRAPLQTPVVLSEARAARAAGHETAAAALLDHARTIHSSPDAALLHVFETEDALQALRFDPSRAASVIGLLDATRPETQVLRVRLALIEADDRAATALLAEMPPPATRRDRVERDVLNALTVLDRDVEKANVFLDSAVREAIPERLVRSIVDAGPDVHRLLKAFVPARAVNRYVDELLAFSDGVVAPVRAKVATSLVEPLSDREVTVLRYLCSRLTNAEIARGLYVSPNTLKSHVRSVYRKLGVASRAEAVDAGRQHGLI